MRSDCLSRELFTWNNIISCVLKDHSLPIMSLRMSRMKASLWVGIFQKNARSNASKCTSPRKRTLRLSASAQWNWTLVPLVAPSTTGVSWSARSMPLVFGSSAFWTRLERRQWCQVVLYSLQSHFSKVRIASLFLIQPSQPPSPQPPPRPPPPRPPQPPPPPHFSLRGGNFVL